MENVKTFIIALGAALGAILLSPYLITVIETYSNFFQSWGQENITKGSLFKTAFGFATFLIIWCVSLKFINKFFYKKLLTSKKYLEDDSKVFPKKKKENDVLIKNLNIEIAKFDNEKKSIQQRLWHGELFDEKHSEQGEKIDLISEAIRCLELVNQKGVAIQGSYIRVNEIKRQKWIKDREKELEEKKKEFEQLKKDRENDK